MAVSYVAHSGREILTGLILELKWYYSQKHDRRDSKGKGHSDLYKGSRRCTTLDIDLARKRGFDDWAGASCSDAEESSSPFAASASSEEE